MSQPEFPLYPPRDWFETPEPDKPQPLTFHSDGRVTGHLALWDQCHISFAECVRPRRGDDFSKFHTGAIQTAEGDQLPIGKVMFDGPHASVSPEMTLEAAANHYDDNTHVGAYVRAKEGRFGIWLAGALKSDLDPISLRNMRANPPSGDWRGRNGKLSLIAALAVPIPGYPIPQVALAASGDIPLALVMQGYEQEEPVETEVRSKEYLRKRAMIASALTAAPLSTASRKNLPTSAFAIPETRSYPIHDMAHARNALARSAGKPEEARVRRAVCRRYPDMGECASK